MVVGAPYEDNGAVYIYLGGVNGLSENPSQKLVAPIDESIVNTDLMFGNGLSKGVDIDGNSFLGKFLNIFSKLPILRLRIWPVWCHKKFVDLCFEIFDLFWFIHSTKYCTLNLKTVVTIYSISV